jgi:hypothetical protein
MIIRDRQTLVNAIPLIAIAIALSEYLFDHTVPRYAGPWFWVALIATVGLLVLVQVLRFTGARQPPAAKPDYSATSVMRRRTEPEDRG